MKTIRCKIICIVLSLALFLPYLFSVPSFAEYEDDVLYASRMGFDNGHINGVSVGIDYKIGDVDSDGKVGITDVQLLKSAIVGYIDLDLDGSNRSDIDANCKVNSTDVYNLKKLVLGDDTDTTYVVAEKSSFSYSSNYKCLNITGSFSNHSVRFDFAGMDTGNAPVTHLVFNTVYNDITVYPVLGSREVGSVSYMAAKHTYNGKSYFSFPDDPVTPYTGFVAVFKTTSAVRISEIFACTNEYSAKWIIDNRINPPAGTPENFSVNISYENIALRLGQMTNDDRTNTNGGMYHDYVNSKWPTVAVDENDKLYITASGCRMAHVDPFGATVLVTSDDGARTFSKPRQISNTIMDDRDSGVTYLGNGTLLATYFTEPASAYLPGGGSYDVMRSRDYGGSSASWQAASWDSGGNPVGGINGTYISMAQFIMKNDKTYSTDGASYVIKSTDYGETWSAEPYSFNRSGASRDMKNMLSNYRITRPGTLVPVTSEHGPVKISDGTVIFAGKVLTETDQPRDTMAVYVSYDDGDTWEYRAEIERPQGYGPNNFHELSVTETKDGALLCAIRTQPSDTGMIDGLPWTGTVFTCHSYDRGRTWTVPAVTGIDATPPHVVTMPNGDIVMVSGHRVDPRCIYANVSTDGGRTWSESEICSGICVNGDDMGYPASAVLSDGSIVTVYYASYHYQNYADQHSSVFAVKWTYSLD